MTYLPADRREDGTASVFVVAIADETNSLKFQLSPGDIYKKNSSNCRKIFVLNLWGRKVFQIMNSSAMDEDYFRKPTTVNFLQFCFRFQTYIRDKLVSSLLKSHKSLFKEWLLGMGYKNIRTKKKSKKRGISQSPVHTKTIVNANASKRKLFYVFKRWQGSP